MIMSCLTGIAMLLLVLFPVVISAAISACHAMAAWRRGFYGPFQTIAGRHNRVARATAC
jgi:hypothetical protein